MYNKDSIWRVINYAKSKRADRDKANTPYLMICQPRRIQDETPAQIFHGENNALGFLGFYSYKYAAVYGQPVDVARNMLLNAAIESGAEYALFVGEDTVLPADAFIRLEELAIANPDAVVSGVYYFKTGGPMVIIEENGRKKLADVTPGRIIENPALIGLDAMLIPTRILKALKDEDPECPFACVVSVPDEPFMGEDEFFLSRLYLNGFRVLVDTNIQCLHMDLATGNYTAHPSVDLKRYRTEIPIGRKLDAADMDYLDKRWVDRQPKPQFEHDTI